MALTVQSLTKIFGSQRAVDDISFEARRGEIVGFLGPNGAGKSTTMKIATSYLPPTSGTVFVNGMDVTVNPLEVKKVLGYLPEHNPLYLDLYVHESLSFTGSLYGLKGSSLKTRVREIIDMCGLEREQNKKIEALSKGYRQRVGLAQALIHDPEVLILDEPTTGLDPNQILEIRKLIRDTSANKTVILSTHIMQEVQALCDRVVVINRGRIVANDRVEDLLRGHGAPVIVVEFGQHVSAALFNEIAGVEQIHEIGPGKFKIIQKTGVDVRAGLFQFASERGLSLLAMKQEEASMESIFRDLTQQSMNS